MKHKTILIITLLIIHANSNGQDRSGFDKEVATQAEYALALCKHIHKNPELSFQEKETSARIASELKSIGFEKHFVFHVFSFYYSFSNILSNRIILNIFPHSRIVLKQLGIFSNIFSNRVVNNFKSFSHLLLRLFYIWMNIGNNSCKHIGS